MLSYNTLQSHVCTSFLISSDETLTIDNVSAVMDKTVGEWREVCDVVLRVPDPVFNQWSSSPRRELGVSYFINVYHYCSWHYLAGRLYETGELAALESARQYITPPPDGMWHMLFSSTVYYFNIISDCVFWLCHILCQCDRGMWYLLMTNTECSVKLISSCSA